MSRQKKYSAKQSPGPPRNCRDFSRAPVNQTWHEMRPDYKTVSRDVQYLHRMEAATGPAGVNVTLPRKNEAEFSHPHVSHTQLLLDFPWQFSS